jgi:hypothetical protein
MLRPGRLFGLLLVAGVVYGVFFHTPTGERSRNSFDPAKLARLEREVWQANAAKESWGLFTKVVSQLREQNGYTWFRAVDAGFHRARVIAAFRQTRTHMEQLLPDLERVYTIERDWFNASFDPKAVATAELSAWIARRRPELSNEQYVGGLIAERDGLRYSVPPSMMAGPGLLEARAALILDSGQPDWAVIGATLRESYDVRHQTVNQIAALASR